MFYSPSRAKGDVKCGGSVAALAHVLLPFKFIFEPKYLHPTIAPYDQCHEGEGEDPIGAANAVLVRAHHARSMHGWPRRQAGGRQPRHWLNHLHVISNRAVCVSASKES